LAKNQYYVGLYIPSQLNQPTARPTMRWVFPCCEGIDLLHLRAGPRPAMALVLRVQPGHQQVLALLGPGLTKNSLNPPIDRAESGLAHRHSGSDSRALAEPVPSSRIAMPAASAHVPDEAAKHNLRGLHRGRSVYNWFRNYL
jgi:hypothetical protein